MNRIPISQAREESVQNKNQILLIGVLSLLVICLFSFQAFGQEVKAQIERISDTTHIEFSGLKSWNYSLDYDDKKKATVLRIPQINDESLGRFLAWSDKLIPEVRVNRQGLNGQVEIEFPHEKSKIEFFDYLTEEPNRLIIDAFAAAEPKKEKKSKAKKVGKKKSKTTSKKKQIAQGKLKDLEGYTELQRSPAGTELLEVKQNEGKLIEDQGPKMIGIFDGGDPNYDRFRMKDYQIKEEAIIRSFQNIYIHFPMLKMETSRLSHLDQNPPIYRIKPTEAKENKQARFILLLKERGKEASFIKALQLFQKTFPKSQYEEILKNSLADLLYERWRKTGDLSEANRAKETYLSLIHDFPESILDQRNRLRVFYMKLEMKDALGVLQAGQDFLRKNPNSEEAYFVKRAIAEAYLILGKYTESYKTYEELHKGESLALAAEAQYRKGDVAFTEGQYKEASKEYRSTIKKLPDFEGIFPNATYNLAEALFWQGKYKESLDSYVRFVELFPAHEHGAYALTRIGENLEILGADKPRVMGAFLESYFRHRGSDGAGIARVRMLSQKIGLMKENELRDAIREMDEIVKSSKLPKIREFATLMLSTGLQRRGQYQRAIDILVSHYQKNPTETNLPYFKKRVLANMSEILHQHNESEQAIKALNYFEKYQKNWLRDHNRMDIDYSLALAQEQAGLLERSEASYQNLLARRTQIKGSQEEKERQVHERLPASESLRLRLAKINMEQRDFRDAFDQLSQIEKIDRLSDAEKVERVRLAAQVYEQRGEFQKAKVFVETLIAGMGDKPVALAPAYLKLSEIQKRLGQNEEALESVNRVVSLGAEAQKIRPQALELKGEIEEVLGRPVSAVESYMTLLNEYEKKMPLAAIRYRAGRILFEARDFRGAENIWSQIKGPSGEVYRKLAAEKQSQLDWDQNYKRYVDRIPAMKKSDLNDQKSKGNL